MKKQSKPTAKKPLSSKVPAVKPAFPDERPVGWRSLPWIILFFLLDIFGTDTAVTYTDIIIACVCTVLLLTVGKRMDKSRLNWQFAFTLLYILLAGISCFYAKSGMLALTEFVKLLLAFCVYLLIVMLSGHGSGAGRNAAAALSVGSALLSFLSIDLTSTRWFSGAFQSFMGQFTQTFAQSSGVEAGTRINSILPDPNVFAGIAGLGVLLALGLALSSSGREKRLHLVCLYLSSLGFVLAFSLGATAFVFVSFIAFILFLPKGSRISGFVLMLETLILTSIGAFLCYKSVFDGTVSFSLVPLLCMIAGSAGLCLIDQYAGVGFAKILENNKKTSLAVLIGCAAVIVLYIAAAANITGAAGLSAGESLSRAEYLAPGSYTCSAVSDAGVKVSVQSQNSSDLMTHSYTDLYSGSAESAAFTVPDDSEVVWFSFSSENGGTVSSFSYSGPKSGELKLEYKLMPGFIANRLQGLGKNQNAIQRLVFWSDGIKLWEKSPVIGRGLGSFSNELYSVASFFYVSKYVHNHYIQLLADMGVVGLAVFLGLLFCSGRLLWLSRKKSQSSLLPCLGAALTFMILQAVVQVDFSSFAFLPFAFGVFAIIDVCASSSPMALAESKPAESTGAAQNRKSPLPQILRLSSAALVAAWVLMLILNRVGNSIPANNNDGKFFSKNEAAIKYDPCDRASYMLTYMCNAQSANSNEIDAKAAKYAEKLIDMPNNYDPCYVAEYYFVRGDFGSAFKALQNHLAFNRVRPDAWQYAFNLLAMYDNGSADFKSGARQIVSMLDDWNAQATAKITLTDENNTYIKGLK